MVAWTTLFIIGVTSVVTNSGNRSPIQLPRTYYYLSPINLLGTLSRSRTYSVLILSQVRLPFRHEGIL